MAEIVLFGLLDQYSDWEAAYVSSLIMLLGQGAYEVKTVAPHKDTLRSMGGFSTLPDYDFASAPRDFAGLLLIGGLSWRATQAPELSQLVQTALDKGKVLAGICDATVFLGTLGVLNTIKHTSNDLQDLKQWAGHAYTGDKRYHKQPAVRDGNIVTANGTASLEFAREVLLALGIAAENTILEWYSFHKQGCYNAPMPGMPSSV